MVLVYHLLKKRENINNENMNKSNIYNQLHVSEHAEV